METFVVRVWVPADSEIEDHPAELHGVVEHVLSKRGRPFRDEDDLMAFIRACLPGAPRAEPAPEPADLARTSLHEPGTDARDAPSVRGIPGDWPAHA